VAEMVNRIREAIKQKGIKNTYVIRKTGLSKSAFYDIMNGNAIPSLLNARLIADAIEVPLTELFPEQIEEGVS
jgi:putative transcriptional regulator